MSRMMSAFVPLARLQSEMNRLFEDFFVDMPTLRPFGAGFPGMNLWEDNDAAYIEAELPGVSLEALEVLVMGNEVTINGERKIPEQKEAAYHRRERSHGRFTRTLTLPWEIDADKVEAKLQDGVLTLKLPKSETAKPKKVQVLPA